MNRVWLSLRDTEELIHLFVEGSETLDESKLIAIDLTYQLGVYEHCKSFISYLKSIKCENGDWWCVDFEVKE